MKYSVTAKSVVGRIRRNNEDNFFLDGELLSLDHMDSSLLSKTFTDEKSHMVGVFDGMGGYNDGEKASYIAALAAKKYAEEKPYDTSQPEVLNALCMEANDEVCKEADGSPMGTTCALLSFYDGKYTVCNIGDSPVFLCRNGMMTQISVDHNQKATYEKATGKAAPAGQKFKLTQCIGIPEDEMLIEPYTASDAVRSGDFFLLCSDGVTDMVPFEDIQGIIQTLKDPKGVIEELIRKAMEAGGRDNITAVCVLANDASNRVRNLDGFLKRFFG